MQSAQYREYVIKSAKHLVASFSKEMQKEGTQLNHMHVNMAALLSLVSVWTKDSSLYRQSYLIFEAFLHQFEKETSNFDVYRDPNKLRNHSCPFTGYPFIMCLRNLQSTERVWNQMIRKWDLDRLQKRISEVVFVFCRPMQKGDHNQAMARTLGTAQALKYLHFVKHEHQQVWSNHVDETWEEWRAYEDTCENAPSYNAIYFWCLLMILDLYPNKLKYFMESKRAYSVFKRYRDQISPSFCTIPKYGDDGGPGGLFFRSADAWPAIFEKVASVFDDETFQWAAFRIFQGEKDGKHHATRQPQMLLMLAMASNWKSKVLKTLPPPGGSAILYRGRDTIAMPKGIQVADKIVLTQHRYSQTPFVMFEIFSRGHHSHFHPGSLIWYDNGQQAMFTSLGYHNSYLHQANSLFIDRYEPQRYWQDNSCIYREWQLCQVPTVLLKPLDNGDHGLRIIEGITYRFENPTNSTIHLQIAKVILEGHSECLLLEHFDDPRFQMTNAHVLQLRPSEIFDASTLSFLDILVLPGVSFNNTDKRSPVAVQKIVVDTQRFQYLKFWWRIQSEEIIRGLKPSSFIVRTSDALYDITPLNPKFLLHFDNQTSEVHYNSEGDQLAYFRFLDYVEEDIEFRRFSVLLKEGILLIIDKLNKPLDKIVKKRASVIWHVLADDILQDPTVLEGETSESNCSTIWAEFCGFPTVDSLNTRTNDPTASLLFVTPKQQDQAVALCEPSFWGIKPKSIVLGQELERVDTCVTYISLFYPKQASLDSRKIVSKILWNQLSSSSVHISLQTCVHSLRILLKLSVSGGPEWSVSRI